MSAQLTDRELLEFAAKAASMGGAWGEVVDIGGDKVDLTDMWFLDPGSAIWDPLNDDGDALRLAVKLRMVIHVWDDADKVSVAKTLPDGDDPDDTSGSWTGEGLRDNKDLNAAARLAIVRAAAEIGKAMP